jgi:hypothetical protein
MEPQNWYQDSAREVLHLPHQCGCVTTAAERRFDIQTAKPRCEMAYI